MSGKLLHRLIFRFGVWITPLILILSSIYLNLPNQDLHKQTLKSSDFYNELSLELSNAELQPEDINKGFSQILLSAVLSDLATPGWLQNLFETNIDNYSNWLKNEDQNLVLYVPAKEVELSVAKKIDQKTAEISQEFSNQIPKCSTEEAEKIKREGFDLTDNFCLPSSVKNQEQTLSEFMEITEQSVEKSEVLDKIIRNNSLNTFSENFDPNKLLSTNSLQRNFLAQLEGLKNAYLWLGRSLPFLLSLAVLLFVLDLFFCRSNNKKISHEIRRYFFYVSTGILFVSVVIVLCMGGFVYLNGWVQKLLLPGLSTQTLTNLLALETLKFSFNTVSLAVYLAIGMFLINLIWGFVETSGILSNIKSKNAKLQTAGASITKNPTFDGDFQRTRMGIKEEEKGVNDYFQKDTLKKIDNQKDPQLLRINDFNESYPEENTQKLFTSNPDKNYDSNQNLDQDLPRSN